MEARELTNSPPLAFELSLRIRHPSVDPADLSDQLRMKPKHSFRAGEPRRSRREPASTSVHGESYWLGTLDPAAWPAENWISGFANVALARKELSSTVSRSLGWALSLCARRFQRAHAALFERIRLEGGRVSLLVALSPVAVESFSLTPEVSRIFGELGITLEFELTID